MAIAFSIFSLAVGHDLNRISSLVFQAASQAERRHEYAFNEVSRAGENVLRFYDFVHVFLLFAKNPCRESGKGL
jgi:hypothetical protein